MFSVALLVISLLGAALVVLGVGVYLRNKKNQLNKLFFFFALWVTLWIVVNYVAAVPTASHVVSLWANRLVLVVGGIALLYLFTFVLQLARWNYKAKHAKYVLVISILSWIVSLTPYVTADVYVENDQVVIVFGSLAVLYFVPLFLTALAIGIALIRAHTKLRGLRRIQVDAISKSILVVTPVVVIGNAVLPIFGNYELVNYTPLSLSLVVFMMAYVIARHRLFNIRPLIVRSLAYVASLGVISAIYALGAHYISTLISTLHNSLATAAANVLLVVLIITFFQPVKQAFDRATKGIFYRDAYDPQDLLNELNRAHVTNLDIEKLTKDSAEIISKYLKTQFCAISLTGNEQMRTYVVGGMIPSEVALERLYQMADASKQVLFIVDDVEDEHTGVIHELDLRNIAVLMKLRQGNRTASSIIGYLVIGPRKSGTAFTETDLRTLETAVNELSLAVQNALNFEEIQKFNITLQEKVENATRKLRRANDKLILMDETKDEFISMASHQLRTPLTSVKGYISMVMEGDAGPINDMQNKLLDQAFVSSQRMVYLIADLLNVSRLRTGKFVIEASPVNLATLIEGEVAQLQETAKGRNLELSYEKPESFPTLMIDETKIRQVAMNFMDNAIYYTPAGGHIHVKLTETESMVAFTVIDDGIGVSKHEQPHLFSKFFRAGNARKARPDGTGLGLFMAKKVVVAQGGAILFKSQEGKGSTFGFTFAKAPLLPTPTPSPQEKATTLTKYKKVGTLDTPVE